MTKKEMFKEFVSKNPSFAKSVNDGKITWQKLFETYDIYGESSDVWNEYRNFETKKETSSFTIAGLLNTLKDINLDSFQENIGTLQKAVGFLEDITKSDGKKEEKKKVNNNPKDFERFYSD